MKNILLCCLIHFIFLFIIPNYITNNNNLFVYLLLLDIATFKNYL